MKRSFADILAGLDDDRARKVARKLPEWAAAGAEIPSALSLEQCSSTATARYKASLAAVAPRGGSSPRQNFASLIPPTASQRVPPVHEATGGHGFAGATSPDVSQQSIDDMPAPPPAPETGNINTVLDLTGGLGVDSWAFSQVAERVVYFERDAELAAAAERNFARLGADNIEVRCETVTPDTKLPEADLIYADPARRDAAGRKVFLLEDCTPDILTLLPMLLQKAPAVLLKLSPMADLTMLTERLGPALLEIHVVELDGEVKELLCLLKRDFSTSLEMTKHSVEEPEIVVALLTSAGTASRDKSASADRPGPGTLPSAKSERDLRDAGGSGDMPPFSRGRGPSSDGRGPAQPDVSGGSCPLREAIRFRLLEEREASAVYAAGVEPGEVLLEPCPALLKAGAFRLPCERWELRKLAPSTHLYLLPGTNTAPSAPGEPVSKIPGTETPHFAPGNPFFKARRVSAVLPFGAAAFKELKRRYPKAEITARNLPLGSDALRRKMGIAPGGDTHIFGCSLADGSAVLLVCEAIS